MILAAATQAATIVGWLLIVSGAGYLAMAVPAEGYKRNVRLAFGVALLVCGLARLLDIIPLLVVGIVGVWAALYYGVMQQKRARQGG